MAKIIVDVEFVINWLRSEQGERDCERAVEEAEEMFESLRRAPSLDILSVQVWPV